MPPSNATAGIVALIGADADARVELARYLNDAGFLVHEFGGPPARPRPGWSLVWLTAQDDALAEVSAGLEAWLEVPDAGQAVLVTWRPAAFRLLLDLDHVKGRLTVLASPVFAWVVVDALRGATRTP